MVSVIPQLFQGQPNGIQHVFDNLTVKHMDALRRQIQSLLDYVLNDCFWTYAMLRMIHKNCFTSEVLFDLL